MFNVIRIPTKFNKPISRLSDKDQLRLYKLIRDIWDWKIVVQTDDVVWDLLSLIYAEWMNMEVRNGYKREGSHLCDPEWVGESCPSDSGHRVEYSIIEYNKIEENKLKKETTGYENKKPQVIENDNLKEREREREEKWKDKEKYEEDLQKIIDFWNSELNRKYEITWELKDAYKKIKIKYDRSIIEEVVLSYIEKCKKMDKQYHLSPFKFFTQKNWFITTKNS